MTESWCEFRSVSKIYDGQTALSGVSFVVTAGEHTAILGASGCGKSTLLRLLAGLDAPSAGQVLLDGNVVSQPQQILRPPHLRNVAMVFQDLALWPNLSVRGNILLGLSGAGLTRQAAHTRAREALALCAVESLAERKPGTISGGQQQRVALARAIAVRPSYLLLDEPFSGLDLMTKSKLLEEIAALVVGQKITVLLVTHDPLEAMSLCRSALVLDNGRIAECGRWADLLRAPRSPVLKIFRDYRSGIPTGV
ncbi:MAG TPA: ABC transporter ATP-binding protein [Candidatus Binatia bacterium]|nr:ABC transporter ATP-binding protein [Candidatus Binatia bacterium]